MAFVQPQASELRCVERDEHREEFVSDRARLFQEWTSQGAVLSTVSGQGLGVLSDAIVERWGLLSSTGSRLHLLMDFGGMPAYDTSFRRTLTEWARDNRAYIEAIDLLSGSKVVTMGAGVANVVLGGMVKVHTDAAQFDARALAAGIRPLTR